MLGLPLVIIKSLIVYVIVYSMMNFHFATISSVIGTFATVLYYIPFLLLTFFEFFAYFRCMLSDPGYCRYHTADSDDAGDNDNENTTWVEYWLADELVHRSAHVRLKKAMVSTSEAGSFKNG